MRIVVAILLFASAVLADSGNSVIERLAEAAWLPLKVRAEWHPSGTAPDVIGQHNDWRVADPRPTRLAGSLIMTLERTGGTGSMERTAVSGTLRIYGPSLTVKRALSEGTPVTPADIETQQAEWTYLKDNALQEVNLQTKTLAARRLIPGRVLTTRDLKAAPCIRRGQSVDLWYAEGTVRVHLTGRALQDGAVGARVPIAVELGASRKFDGRVMADGTAQLIR